MGEIRRKSARILLGIFVLITISQISSSDSQVINSSSTQHVLARAGWISSPKFPEAVLPSSRYRWMINIPEAESITIFFSDLDVSSLTSATCSRNYVMIFDGRAGNIPLSICTYRGDASSRRFCNRARPSQSLTIQSNLVYVEYCAPPRGQVGRGFRFYYQEAHGSSTRAPVTPFPAGVTTPSSSSVPTGLCTMDTTSSIYCGCGRSVVAPSTPRIVGGQEARPHAWPYVVHVRRKFEGRFYGFCGGTLISNLYVVTAAHCIEGFADPSLLDIRVGEHSRFVTEAAEEDYAISEITVHPNYQKWDSDNDIAVLKLSRFVTLKNEVNVICLPPAGSDPPAGTQATVVGWGDTSAQDVKMIKIDPSVTSLTSTKKSKTSLGSQISGAVSRLLATGRTASVGNSSVLDASKPEAQAIIIGEERSGAIRVASNVLMQVTVPVIDRTECNGLDYYRYQITNNMFCAGLSYGTMDSCKGDSGGPLMAVMNGRWTLIGVVSWGEGCAVAKKPGVYTRVGLYVDWLNQFLSSAG
ncbi:hypothetical protein RvY_16631 [Ramazzottius varieornatus]|uniref:Vitamin K-dependent protein C n=1 Tax=Ramazzottius varieornatus TaxID=947166 RepID=A0A1D1W5I3_RAMVA|nr:hypothetical protein RvY_16631 [Ramazzottius varieornatus]